MRARNKKIVSSDIEWLKTIKEEYEQIGFDTALRGTELTVFALKQKKVKKKTDEKRKRNG